MTDNQKLNKLKEIAKTIEDNKLIDGSVPNAIKEISRNSLLAVDECNESWCDCCPVREQVGLICSDWLEL